MSEFEEGDGFNPEPDIYSESIEVQEFRRQKAEEDALREQREQVSKPEHRRREDAMAEPQIPQLMPPPGKQPLLTLGDLESTKPVLKWIGLGALVVFACIGFKSVFMDR